jgi:hypothetical protein
MIGSNHLYEVMSDHVSGPSTETAHAPFTKAFGANVFEYYASVWGSVPVLLYLTDWISRLKAK